MENDKCLLRSPQDSGAPMIDEPETNRPVGFRGDRRIDTIISNSNGDKVFIFNIFPSNFKAILFLVLVILIKSGQEVMCFYLPYQTYKYPQRAHLAPTHRNKYGLKNHKPFGSHKLKTYSFATLSRSSKFFIPKFSSRSPDALVTFSWQNTLLFSKNSDLDIDLKEFDEKNGTLSMISQLTPASEIAYFYLQSLGLSEANMWDITCNHGTILGLTVSNLKNKISFLKENLELSDDDISKAISCYPSLLCLSPSENLVHKIDFWKNTLNMSTEELRKIFLWYPCVLSYSITNLNQKALFFTSVLNYTTTDTRNLLLANPQLVALSVKENLLPKFHFLWNDMKLDISTIEQAIEKNPSILLYSLKNNLKPKFIYFRDKLGMNPEELNKLLNKYPPILDHKLDETVIPLTNYFLDELGFNAAEFRKILLKFPRLVTYSLPRKIKHLVGYLKYELGFDSCKIKRTLFQAPQVISLSESTLLQKVEYLRTNAVPEKNNEMLIKLISGMPTLLLCNIDQNIKPKVNFLRMIFASEDKTREVIVAQPTLLGYSLEKRIKPRLEALIKIGEDVRRIGLGITLSDDKFNCWIKSLEKGEKKKLSMKEEAKAIVTKYEYDKEVEENKKDQLKGRITTWPR